MESKSSALNVYFVIGEESGDALGADLLIELRKLSKAQGTDIEPCGLGGPLLRAQGVNSLFDINDIAVMGLTDVLLRLPTIISRIRQTIRDILEVRPDIIVLIDSPEFTHAVAKRVRKKWPDVPIINYVCPSVWAWRKYRARKMAAYIDHVLTLLPFEPEKLQELGGPPGTYVGHPLSSSLDAQRSPEVSSDEPPMLLILPGSRHGEISRHMQVMGETVALLRQRGCSFRPVVLSVPHQEALVRGKTAAWSVKPEILSDEDAKQSVFSSARVALAASGTVTLELALSRVPMVAMYILDPLARRLIFLIRIWTVSLPNLIADYVIVPEDMNEYVSADRLARQLERLFGDTPERQAQLEGFEQVASRMAVPKPASQAAAEIVMKMAGR